MKIKCMDCAILNVRGDDRWAKRKFCEKCKSEKVIKRIKYKTRELLLT